MSSALLMYNNLQASTHAGVIRLIGMHFVATGKIPKEMGRFYSKLFELRQRGDHDDWIEIGSEDILPILPDVEEYLGTLLQFFDFDKSGLTDGTY